MTELVLRAFLFTDLVGSTARWDTDAAAMSAALSGSAFMPDGSARTEVFDGDDLVGARARWAAP